ncbi:MAG: hypothetical protein AVDCRST_MAG87-3978 [uncultured Thermomicrobiales bacterium]|uniref:HTH tetR-type domain-containing protein n=1 Tax=uncultured Thermomicrobiales bacterium TaxID=1645740 RepID=A0A6J4VUV7_9BACT|nr:MAG: hypothetical protein AVDCRST_MAG87-3978 [uncultured Thermomicrobiales bacterium]
MHNEEIGRHERKRDSTVTRAAILQAARVLFTRDSYDHVGMRDIARLVGVDATLVVRYFGTKERLFAEAIAQGLVLDKESFGQGRDGLGERLARSIVAKGDAKGEFDIVLVLLRSASNEQAASLLREALDEQFGLPMAEWLGGERARERASVIIATLFGIAFARNVIRSEPLAGMEPEELVALIAPILQGYIDQAPP